MWKRAFLDIICLISLFAFPWWCTVALCLAALFMFDHWYEIIILALLADLLYGVPELRFHNIILGQTILSIIVFIAVQFLKTKLLAYHS